MSGLTFTEKLGLIEQVLKFQDSNASQLKDRGYDAKARGESLRKKRDVVVVENDKQEKLKVDLRDETQKVNAGLREAYVTASGDLEAMAGVLGKDTELSKQLKRLRSNLKRAGKAGAEEAKAA